MTTKRDHGGDLDRARARFGGAIQDWLDLSTGIAPWPYPLPEFDSRHWQSLPSGSAMTRLEDVARRTFSTQAEIIPFSGAQGAIGVYPNLAPPGTAKVLGPTYNEHAAALSAAGWTLDTVTDVADLAGADLAVVVNPNNPDGHSIGPRRLAALSGDVRFLIIDESFADAEEKLSFAPRLHEAPNVVLLRSFGKFYGLAGLRLGFALATGEIALHLRALSGPWPVSGPAIEVATQAYADQSWKTAQINRATAATARLDALAREAGWRKVGGTVLFGTWEVGDAADTQETLAQGQVWSRIFPYSSGWLRLGLPPDDRWAQLEHAFQALA